MNYKEAKEFKKNFPVKNGEGLGVIDGVVIGYEQCVMDVAKVLEQYLTTTIYHGKPNFPQTSWQKWLENRLGVAE